MNKIIALCLYLLGKKYSSSTFIDEDTITAGYGKLDHIGLFKYNLPNWLIFRIYKCKTWSKWMELRNK
jgi:hypothetical protein